MKATTTDTGNKMMSNYHVVTSNGEFTFHKRLGDALVGALRLAALRGESVCVFNPILRRGNGQYWTVSKDGHVGVVR